MDKNKREEFYKNASLYFENDIIKEIYSTDTFCICNVANHNYAIFTFPQSKEQEIYCKKNGPIGVYVSRKFVLKVINDNSYLSNLYYLDDKVIESLSFFLNEKNLLFFKKLKQKFDLNGPSDEIDFSMEEMLLNKGRSK